MWPQLVGLAASFLGGGSSGRLGQQQKIDLANSGTGPMPDTRPPAPDIDPVTENPGPVSRGVGIMKRGLKFADNQLDKPLGGAIGNYVASVDADSRAQRNANRARRELRSEGLTAFEAAGVPGGGQGTATSGNTLGNGPPKQLQTQQQFQAEQAALDRKNQLEIAKTHAEPGNRQASVAEFLAPYTAGLSDANRKKVDAEHNKVIADYQKVLVDTKRAQFDLDTFWQQKFATMGPENIIAAVTMFNSGLNINDLLTRGSLSAAETEDAKRLWNVLLAMKSRLRVESVGIEDLFDYLVSDEDVALLRKEQSLGFGEYISNSFLKPLGNLPFWYNKATGKR